MTDQPPDARPTRVLDHQRLTKLIEDLVQSTGSPGVAINGNDRLDALAAVASDFLEEVPTDQVITWFTRVLAMRAQRIQIAARKHHAPATQGRA